MSKKEDFPTRVKCLVVYNVTEGDVVVVFALDKFFERLLCRYSTGEIYSRATCNVDCRLALRGRYPL
jgi:hypothetical protein